MSSAGREMLNDLFGGVGETRGGGIVVNDVDVAWVLIRWADDMKSRVCSEGADCASCLLDREMWWGLYNDLAGPVRLRAQKLMIGAGVPLPPAPSEEVHTNVIPFTRR